MNPLSRRKFGLSLVAGIAGAGATLAGVPLHAESGKHLRNISAYRFARWHDHFDNLKHGVILVDTKFRALHYWSEDGTTHRLFPTSVPLTPELTRLGRTKVIGKRENPSWTPTASMLERNPDWPTFMPPGPDNPLGTHALYLSWPAYRIHGTHDTRKIGRRASQGCIGLYNEDIAVLYDWAEIGTQVVLI